MTTAPKLTHSPAERVVRERLVTEALRVYRRYALEIVEAFDVCPFAATARARGHVREWVSLDRDPDPGAVLALVEEAAAQEEVEIGLLLFPRATPDRVGWERFVANVQQTAQRLAAAEPDRASLSRMAMAAFHPSAEPVMDDPARLVPFLRRTPDPTIQLVRKSVLDKVRGQAPRGTAFVDPTALDFAALTASSSAKEKLDLSDRIAQANLETVQGAGVDRFEGIFEDIARDRAAAYAPLIAMLEASSPCPS